MILLSKSDKFAREANFYQWAEAFSKAVSKNPKAPIVYLIAEVANGK